MKAEHWLITIATAAGPLRLEVWLAEEAGRPRALRLDGGPAGLQGLLSATCAALRLGFQAPAPGFLREVIQSFRGRRDETAGAVVGDPLVLSCTSVADYIAQALDARFPEVLA